MRAEIICVGSELLLGDITDTNTRYLALRLSGLGIDLHYSTTVGDNRARLVDCLRRAMRRSDIVLTTGGLGPTDDDITREAIADLFGETAIVDEALARALREFFALRGIEMTPNNLKQASLIPSAQGIANTRGTAPGWWVTRAGRSVIAMPGPPGEMQHMWESEIEPRLQRSDSVIRSRTLKLFNISESMVDNLLKPLTPSSNPTVAVYAKQDGIHVRITAKADDDATALRAIEPVEKEVRSALGEFLWGTDSDTQESVVAALLTSRGTTLAIAESVTSGHLSSLLGAAAGSESYFRGALVMPRSAAAGREEDCVAMAGHALQQFGADMGLGVLGRAVEGTDAPMDEVVVAVVWPSKDRVVTGVYRSRPHRVRTLGVYYALHELRKVLSLD
ncbi:MAG: CinA family nicotinamide mononucleotide deamidase-related protein [Chloroflexi bacterium]|nr:CinA family nicotinamide mononucleotide deamidase-related protein [Chloroflexota bacterium]